MKKGKISVLYKPSATVLRDDESDNDGNEEGMGHNEEVQFSWNRLELKSCAGLFLEMEVCELLSIFHPSDNMWKPEHRDAYVPESSIAPASSHFASPPSTHLAGSSAPNLDDDGHEEGITTVPCAADARAYVGGLKRSLLSVDSLFSFVAGHCWSGSLPTTSSMR